MPSASAFAPLDSLLDLACRDGVDIRPTLLRVLTDLYVQKPSHTAEEQTQYVELARGLIGSVDAPTRATVAARLRGYAQAPAAILEALAPHDGVQTPRRESAAASVIPASDSDRDVDADADADTDLVNAAAIPVEEDPVDLFFSATPEERRLILLNLDVAATAARLPAASTDTIARLEAAALAHDPHTFGRTLAGALDIGPPIAERVVGDLSGEPLVVAAKALAMPAATLQRILLFLDPAIGRSVERVFDLARLFEELPPQSAAQMVALWRGRVKKARPAHEPVYWDDESRGARSLATPAARRAPRAREDMPLRARGGGR